MSRGAAGIRWLPPIADRSPSPEYTTTFNLGFASFSPVANGIARPCVVWKESSFTYPATRPVHPMPETNASDCRSTFDSIKARANEFTVVPIPHPGHHMCGIRSVRRNGSTGFTVSSKTFSIGLPPRWLEEFLRDCELHRRHVGRR